MTVINETNKTRQAGDGIQTDFDFLFKIFEETDLQVYLVDASNVKTLQTITTHYTVSIEPINEGGTVAMLTPPSAVEDLLIVRVLPLTQPTDFPTVGGIREEQVENEDDRSRMIDQQLQETQLRTVRVDIADDSVTSDGLVLPPLESGKVLGNDGSVLLWVDPSSGIRFFFGLDASKSATPLVNDVYFSTDTHTLYTCSTVNVWRLLNPRTTTNTLSVVTNSVNTDLAQGEMFDVDADDDFTLENPTNPPLAGQSQKVIWRIKQDATGSRILTLGSKFRISDDIGTSIVLTTTASRTDYLGAIYHQVDDKYDIVAFRKDVV